MKTKRNIEITQGDTRIVAIPVYDDDTTAEFIDPADADDIEYTITEERGGGTEHHTVALSDPALTVVEAQNVISASAEKPTDLDGIPDNQNIVRVELAESVTTDLPVDLLYHECELRGFRDSVSTVMQGAVDVAASST